MTRDSVELELESPPVHSSTPCEQLERSSENLLEQDHHSIPARNVDQSTLTQSVDQSSTVRFPVMEPQEAGSRLPMSLSVEGGLHEAELPGVRSGLRQQPQEQQDRRKSSKWDGHLRSHRGRPAVEDA